MLWMDFWRAPAGGGENWGLGGFGFDAVDESNVGLIKLEDEIVTAYSPPPSLGFAA